ncbi:MAG: hypothetical protein ACQERE_11010 [Pseudomonadota bacterium]
MTLLDTDDTLVLTEAGLRLAETPSLLDGSHAGRVIALVEDAPETLKTLEGIEVLDHATFVEKILTKHQPVFW